MVDENTVNRLLRAVGRGQVATYRKLSRDIGPNIANRLGYTPLMSAAANYRVEMVRLLLAQGADPLAVAETGGTALHAAVRLKANPPEDQRLTVKLLLEAGADPNARAKTGSTPLITAAWFGCLAGVEELLAGGAEIGARDQEGRTARDCALARGFDPIVALLGRSSMG